MPDDHGEMYEHELRLEALKAMRRVLMAPADDVSTAERIESARAILNLDRAELGDLLMQEDMTKAHDAGHPEREETA